MDTLHTKGWTLGYLLPAPHIELKQSRWQHSPEMSTTETWKMVAFVYFGFLLVVERVSIAPLYSDRVKHGLILYPSSIIQAPTEPRLLLYLLSSFLSWELYNLSVWLCVFNSFILHFKFQLIMLFQNCPRRDGECDVIVVIRLTIPAQFVQRQHLDLFIQNKNKHNDFYPRSIKLFTQPWTTSFQTILHHLLTL